LLLRGLNKEVQLFFLENIILSISKLEMSVGNIFFLISLIIVYKFIKLFDSLQRYYANIQVFFEKDIPEFIIRNENSFKLIGVIFKWRFFN
jgi:hypothetical protein